MTKPFGSGDGRIHVMPSLHPYSIKNGETLKITALVKSEKEVSSVVADLGGLVKVELKPRHAAGTGLISAGAKTAVYEAEWIAAGLEEKVYPVALKVTDGSGHSWTDESLVFSDPSAGLSTPGTNTYPGPGMTYGGAVELEPGQHQVRCAVIDPQGGFAYFGTTTNPGRVVKINLEHSTRVGALTLDSGDNALLSAVIDPTAGFAYFGTASSPVPGAPSRVVKIDLETFTRVDALTVENSGGGLASAVIDPASGYAYFGTDTQPGRVVKIDLGTFSRTGEITLGEWEDGPSCAVIDPAAGYAYFGMARGVVKIDLGTFSRERVLEDTALRAPTAAVIDPERGFAYFGSGQCGVARLDLATFSYAGTVNPDLPGDDNVLTCAMIDPETGYAYFGSNGQGGYLAKLDLETFVFVDRYDVASNENELRCAVINPAAGYAYLGYVNHGYLGNPCQVLKVALADFSYAGRIDLWLPAEETVLACAVIDTAKGFAYFGASGKPGQVVKIDLETFAIVGAIRLEPGEDRLGCAVIDPAAGFAYFGTYTVPGRVVKIDLETFSRVDAITLNEGEKYLSSAVIDTAAGYAYFGTGTYSALVEVVRIDLRTFTRVDAVTLDSGVVSGVIDPAAGYAYLGTANGWMLKIDLETFTKVDTTELIDGAYSAVIDSAAGYAYFVAATGWVMKIDLASLSLVDSFILGDGGYAVIDVAAGFLYIVEYVSHVAKIDLATFTWVATIPLVPERCYARSAVIDPDAGHVYFGTDAYSGRVGKVDLYDHQKGYLKATRFEMTETGTVTEVHFWSHLAAGNARLAIYSDDEPKRLLWEGGPVPNTSAGDFLTLPVSAGTPSVLVLPAGPYWLAWQVDTEEAVPSYTPGKNGNGYFYYQPFGPCPSTLSNREAIPTDETWTEYITYETVEVVPEVRSIICTGSNPSYASEVDFLVTFSEAVGGVGTGDFRLKSIGITGAAISGVTGTGIDYRVTVYTGSGDGKLRLDLLDDNSIVNSSGVALGGALERDGDFIDGEVYTIDRTLPVVTGEITLQDPSPTNQDALTFAVSFSESVTPSFSAEDVTVTGTLAQGARVFIDGVAESDYQICVVPDDPNAMGTVGVSITGSVSDAAGNPVTVPVSSELYSVRNYPGDLNGDGVVDERDMLLFQGEWHRPGEETSPGD